MISRLRDPDADVLASGVWFVSLLAAAALFAFCHSFSAASSPYHFTRTRSSCLAVYEYPWRVALFSPPIFPSPDLVPITVVLAVSCLCPDAQSGGGAPRVDAKDGDHIDANMISRLPDPNAGVLAHWH